MTSPNARFTVQRKRFLRIDLLRLRVGLNLSGKMTQRGSGDHHSMGPSDEYQGKIPRLYACIRHSGLKSPPAASNPFREACCTSGNRSTGMIRAFNFGKILQAFQSCLIAL